MSLTNRDKVLLSLTEERVLKALQEKGSAVIFMIDYSSNPKFTKEELQEILDIIQKRNEK